jgi:hypothetical protein
VPLEALKGNKGKANITLATSASWERTQAQGGGLDAIREIMVEIKEGS